MRLVIVESPYAGNVDRHIQYAREAIRDCLHRGEAPIASHLLYTQPGILVDELPSERALGMVAGQAWYAVAHAAVVYEDLGISPGMQAGIDEATRHGLPIIARSLDAWRGKECRPSSPPAPMTMLADRVATEDRVGDGTREALNDSIRELLDAPGLEDHDKLQGVFRRLRAVPSMSLVRDASFNLDNELIKARHDGFPIDVCLVRVREWIGS